MLTDYTSNEPPRAEIDAMKGPLLLEFGSNTCPICRGARPVLEEALAGRATLPHIRIEDGSGRKLGRSFGVKLWPTLIFLKDGKEIARLVRPDSAASIQQALALM